MIFTRGVTDYSWSYKYRLLLIMKLAIFFTLAFAFYATAESKAQKITLHAENIPLGEVMKEVQKQQGYSFLFRGDEIADMRVNIRLKRVEFADAMDIILTKSGLDWSLDDGIITISERRLPSEMRRHISQQHDVTGKVTDEEGNPLLGVTVVRKENTQIGTTTDANGVYALLNLPDNATLIYRYVGYLEQEIAVGNQTSIDVTLVLDQAGLEEVVVVGFGQQKKESVVASVSSIKGEQLRMPNRSLSNNLAGQLPGLIAVQRSGEPGYDNAEFWIRGVSSFAGGTTPLVLVDGVPRDMNDIEPDEIESFTLLKDAAATSVYGSEGANGVILITSKRGRVQKTTISYRAEASRLTPTRVPQFVGSYDYLSLYNEARRNDGLAEEFTAEDLEKYRSGIDPDLYPDVNWWDALMRDHTFNTRHTLNFRGGGERARYFVSGAYFGESGLYNVHNDYDNNAGVNRYNLRSNVDIDITSTTLLRVDLSGQYLKVNRSPATTESLFTGIYSSPPHIIPVIYSDGTLSYNSSAVISKNPYNDLVESGYRKEWRAGIQSKVELNQKLDFWLQGLQVRGAVSFDANSIYNTSRLRTPGEFFATGRDSEGNLLFNQMVNATPFGNPTTSSSGNKNIYMEGAINYDQSFDRHTVGGMFLYYQKERQLTSDALAFRKQAWIGRATYNFDQRYILEGNFSVTGSEQFADGYRYGFFPAVGFAWNVTNETYYPEGLKRVLSELKFRVSVGQTGNDNTGSARFLYRPTFGTSTGYDLGIGSTGSLNSVGTSIIEGRFESPGLSWEIELKRNYGVDFTLFNGMLQVQADYFNNLRTNILLQRRTVSGVAGFQQTPWQNYGKVSNKGVDGSLNARHRFGELEVSLRGNFTFARNKILEYDEVTPPYPWMAITGTRLNTLTGLQVERLFTDDDFNITQDGNGNRVYELKDGIPHFTLLPNPKPGDIKYIDLNGDGVVDNNVDRIMGYSEPTVPEIIYGFGANFSYKGAYASAFFQGAGNVALSLIGGAGQRSFALYYEGVRSSSIRQEIFDSHWTEENPRQDVLYPRLSLNRENTIRPTSTWWARNAAFLRLKNIEAGYNFSPSFLQSARITGLRLYVMGQNLAVWDQVKVQDPEMAASGGGAATYPLPSIWTIGLDVTF